MQQDDKKPSRLTRIDATNRADIKIHNLEDLTALGVFSEEFAFAADILELLGPVTLEAIERGFFDERQGENVSRFNVLAGIEGGVSSRKIRSLLRLAGAGNQQARAIARLLPSLSAGFKFTPSNPLNVNDHTLLTTDTILRFEAQANIVPSFVQTIFDKWKRAGSFDGTSSPITVGANISVSNTDSYLGGFFNPTVGLGLSTVDNQKTYSAGITVKLDAATAVEATLEVTVERKTVTREINGVNRTITFETKTENIVFGSNIFDIPAHISNLINDTGKTTVTAFDYFTREDIPVRRVNKPIDGHPDKVFVEFEIVNPGDVDDTYISGRGRVREEAQYTDGTRVTNVGGENIYTREVDGLTQTTRVGELDPSSGIISTYNSETGETNVIIVIGDPSSLEGPVSIEGTRRADGTIDYHGHDSNSNEAAIINAGLNEADRLADCIVEKSKLLLSISDGDLTISRAAVKIAEGKRLGIPSDLSFEIVDGKVLKYDDVGRKVTIVYARNGDGKLLDKDGNVVTDLSKARILRTEHADKGVEVISQRDSNDKITSVTVKAANSPVGFDFEDVGSVLRSVLGNRIVSNPVAKVVTSAALCKIEDMHAHALHSL